MNIFSATFSSRLYASAITAISNQFLWGNISRRGNASYVLSKSFSFYADNLMIIDTRRGSSAEDEYIKGISQRHRTITIAIMLLACRIAQIIMSISFEIILKCCTFRWCNHQAMHNADKEEESLEIVFQSFCLTLRTGRSFA